MLINDERMIKCMDVLHNLIEITIQRADSLFHSKDPQNDMLKPLHTLVYASKRLDIDELHSFQKWCLQKYGKVFLMVSEKEPRLTVYEEVLNNIDVYMPQTGEKVAKLVEVATSKAVPYSPIGSSLAEYNAYKMSKGKWENQPYQPQQQQQTGPVIYQKPVVVAPPMINPMPIQIQPMQMPIQNVQPQPQYNPMPPNISNNAYPSLSYIKLPTNPPPQTYNPPPQQPQIYNPPPVYMPPPTQPTMTTPPPQNIHNVTPTTQNVQPPSHPQPQVTPTFQPSAMPPTNVQQDDILADLEKQINDLKKD